MFLTASSGSGEQTMRARRDPGLTRSSRLAGVLGAVLLALPPVADAESLGEMFRRVNPSVVVIRGKGSDVEGAGGLTRFTETGSGVLV
jgi:hypothetical protein